MSQQLSVRSIKKSSRKQIFLDQLLLSLRLLEKRVRELSCYYQCNQLYFVESTLNQSRRSITPNLPTSIDFDIPLKYKKTINGERYLLADRVQRCEGEVVQRVIVFSTDEQLRTLFTSQHVMMDGTFHSCPRDFEQIYSIHAITNDQSNFFLQ